MHKLIMTLAIAALSICASAQQEDNSQPSKQEQTHTRPRSRPHRSTTADPKGSHQANQDEQDLVTSQHKDSAKGKRAGLRRQKGVKEHDETSANRKERKIRRGERKQTEEGQPRRHRGKDRRQQNELPPQTTHSNRDCGEVTPASAMLYEANFCQIPVTKMVSTRIGMTIA